MALPVAAMYLLAVALFDDRVAAFFAALLIALIPEQLAVVGDSRGGAFGVAGARRGAACRALSVGARTAALVRPQWLPHTRPVPAGIAADRADHRRVALGMPPMSSGDPGSGGPAAALVLVAVHIGHTFAVRNEAWGTMQARLSLALPAINLSVNGPSTSGTSGSRSSSPCWLRSAWRGRGVRAGAPGAGAISLFFGVNLLFYAGSYNYGADVRYSLLTYPPLAVWVAWALEVVADGQSHVG